MSVTFCEKNEIHDNKIVNIINAFGELMLLVSNQ